MKRIIKNALDLTITIAAVYVLTVIALCFFAPRLEEFEDDDYDDDYFCDPDV